MAPQFLPLLTPAPPAQVVPAKAEPAAPASPEQTAAGPKVDAAIAADARGQYFADVFINGQTVRMMIDTGATVVTLSADVAERLGLRGTYGAAKIRTRTANGVAEMTPTSLMRLSIGAITLNEVTALIADRAAGPVNLIGANVLKQLAAVEQRDGFLYLRQY